jgi:hypothetical protein
MQTQCIKRGLFLLATLGPAIQIAVIPAIAEDHSAGSHWMQVCRGDDANLQLICVGFISGVTEVQRRQPASADQYCLPPSITIGQEKAIIVKFMEDHPQKLHLPFIQLLLDALHEAFPCPIIRTEPPPETTAVVPFKAKADTSLLPGAQ